MILRIVVFATAVALCCCTRDGGPPEGKVEVPTEQELAREARRTAARATYPAAKLLDWAKAEAVKIEPRAEVRQLEYGWGTQNLEFRDLEAVFWVPDADRDIVITVRGPDQSRVRRSRFGNPASLEGIDLLPGDAVRAARKQGLDSQWQRYPAAHLYADLVPRKYQQHLDLPGGGDWIWRIWLSGPGVPEDYHIYLDGQTLEKLGEKRKSV